MCGAGDLAHTVSSALLYILPSFSLLLTTVCGAGDLAHTVSSAHFCLLLSFSLLLTAVCGAGDLAHTVPSALLYILSSFSLLLTTVCGAGDLAHTAPSAFLYILLSFSLLLTAVCGAGDLAHTASSALFLDNTFFSLSFDGHWLFMCANTAVGWLPLGIDATKYPSKTLLQEDIHSLRDDMLLAIGTFIMFNYRTVGLFIDGNCCPYLLSPTAPAPRTRCLGKSVARFACLLRADLQTRAVQTAGYSTWTIGLYCPYCHASSNSSPTERGHRSLFCP